MRNVQYMQRVCTLAARKNKDIDTTQGTPAEKKPNGNYNDTSQMRFEMKIPRAKQSREEILTLADSRDIPGTLSRNITE